MLSDPSPFVKHLIRDMMGYHAQHFADPHVRVRQARNLLDFLAQSVAGEPSPYSLLLKAEVDLLRGKADSYLFHEHLEDCNEPVYFHQFVSRAEAHGLRYLGDVDLRVMTPGNFPREVESVLQMLSPDLIHLEQYMDFLRNRTFRQTLLCHRQQAPRYALGSAQLAGLHVASGAKLVGQDADPAIPGPERHPDPRSGAALEFRGADGVTLSAREPVAKAAMLSLTEAWPEAVPFAELRQEVRKRLGGQTGVAGAPEADGEQLGQTLLRCYTSSASLVELHVAPPRLTRRVSYRPVATPLARHQAAAGAHVTNLRHEVVVLGDFERQVLRRLDGVHDRSALVQALAELVRRGELTVQADGGGVVEEGRRHELLRKAVDEQLQQLARNALLAG